MYRKDRGISKWVNADYINDFFDKWEERVKNAEPITIDVVQNVRSILNETPTTEIVRCKDCKYSEVYLIDSNEEPQRWCKVGLAKKVGGSSDVTTLLTRERECARLKTAPSAKREWRVIQNDKARSDRNIK